MLILSLLFHLAVFSLILFVPEPMPTKRLKGAIYEVHLVELPPRSLVKGKGIAKAKTGKVILGSKKDVQAKRISSGVETKKKPVVIAKRTLTTKREEAKKPKVSSSKLIDQALSRIKKKVEAKKEEETDHVDQALSRIENQMKATAGQEMTGSTPGSGIAIQMYKMEVKDRIESNWSYPALLSPEKEKELEAVVVLQVKSNGTIIKYWFEKQSSDATFDQSVLKAIERTDSLPPFPKGYLKTHEDFEITFNLRDLEGQ